MRTNRRGAEGAERRELGEEMSCLTGAVIGSAIEVHRVLGPGFLESVYEEALSVELQLRGILFKRQPVVAVNYEAQVLSYLKMTSHPLALLINFNVRVLKDGIRRIILSS
jgi:hypothetical protein